MMSYEWYDGTYKYEVRWHTRNPMAPEDMRDVWVIERRILGKSYGKKLKAITYIEEEELKVKLSELESTYCFHDSTIEKITYGKAEKEVVLEITFCRWAQDWYDEENDDEVETLILTFKNVSKTDCFDYTAGMDDKIMDCDLITDENGNYGVRFLTWTKDDAFVTTIFADEVLAEHRENKTWNQPR